MFLVRLTRRFRLPLVLITFAVLAFFLWGGITTSGNRLLPPNPERYSR